MEPYFQHIQARMRVPILTTRHLHDTSIRQKLEKDPQPLTKGLWSPYQKNGVDTARLPQHGLASRYSLSFLVDDPSLSFHPRIAAPFLFTPAAWGCETALQGARLRFARAYLVLWASAGGPD